MRSHARRAGPAASSAVSSRWIALGDEEAEVEGGAAHPVGGVLRAPGPHAARRARELHPHRLLRHGRGRGWRRRTRGWPRRGGRCGGAPGRRGARGPTAVGDVVAVGEGLHHPCGEERGPAHRARDPADALVAGARRDRGAQRLARPRTTAPRSSLGRSRRSARWWPPRPRRGRPSISVSSRAERRPGRPRRAGRAPRRGRGGGPGAARSTRATASAGPSPRRPATAAATRRSACAAARSDRSGFNGVAGTASACTLTLRYTIVNVRRWPFDRGPLRGRATTSPRSPSTGRTGMNAATFEMGEQLTEAFAEVDARPRGAGGGGHRRRAARSARATTWRRPGATRAWRRPCSGSADVRPGHDPRGRDVPRVPQAHDRRRERRRRRHRHGLRAAVRHPATPPSTPSSRRCS